MGVGAHLKIQIGNGFTPWANWRQGLTFKAFIDMLWEAAGGGGRGVLISTDLSAMLIKSARTNQVCSDTL